MFMADMAALKHMLQGQQLKAKFWAALKKGHKSIMAEMLDEGESIRSNKLNRLSMREMILQ